jgi:DNA polymerase-3 subunit gamma/tau
VLGEALVELGKKPDPRIVLEVALVRLCRPDADRSYDAILERLDRLERGLATTSVPPVSSAPAPAAAVTGGPADAARQELARAGAAPRPARASVKKATAPPVEAPPRDPAPAEAAPSGPSAADLPTDAELAAAWPAVADRLKGATRGIFKDSRLAIAGGAIVLTVPKGPPVELLEQRLPEVEKAFAAQLGSALPVELAIGAEAPTTAAAPAEVPADEEPVDVHDLEDAPSPGTGVERLAEAFPGAELVDE